MLLPKLFMWLKSDGYATGAAMFKMPHPVGCPAMWPLRTQQSSLSFFIAWRLTSKGKYFKSTRPGLKYLSASVHIGLKHPIGQAGHMIKSRLDLRRDYTGHLSYHQCYRLPQGHWGEAIMLLSAHHSVWRTSVHVLNKQRLGHDETTL